MVPLRPRTFQLCHLGGIFESDNSWKDLSEKLTSVNSRCVSGDSAAFVTAAENQIQCGNRFATLKTLGDNAQRATGNSERKVKSPFLKAVEFADCKDSSPCSFMAYRTIPRKQSSEDLECSQHILLPTESSVLEDGTARLKERLASIVTTSEKLDVELLEEQKEILSLEKTSGVNSDALESLQNQVNYMQKLLDMAMNNSGSGKDSLKAYERIVADKEEQLLTFKVNWERDMALLEEIIQDLEEKSQKRKSGMQDRLNSIKEMRQGCEEMALKIQLRENAIVEMELGLEKRAKHAPRSAYVRRITELVKNSKKQDADISQIIQETRKLQRESNFVQERLHRTYALVDELVFRDAMKSAICRQVYRLLCSIHQKFCDVFEKIAQADKLGHELQELRARLESLEKEPVDIVSVESHINAVSKENAVLKYRAEFFL